MASMVTQDVDQLLEDVGLFDVRSRKAGKLSGGMKRRLIREKLGGKNE